MYRQAKSTLRSSSSSFNSRGSTFFFLLAVLHPLIIYLFYLFSFCYQRQGLVAHRHAGRRKHTDDAGPSTMDLVVEGPDQEWSDDEYQPVVLKLEVHFAAPKRKQLQQQQPKKKKNNQRGGAVTTTTTWNQTNFSTGSSGFIHLFLPISMTVAAAADSVAAPLRTSTTSVRPVPAATVAAPVSGAEMTVTQRPTGQTFKRVNTNNKKKKKKKKAKRKKKKNNNKIHQQPIDESSSSNTMDSAVGDVTASVVDQRYKPMQASPSNRLMPLLLHDDGIPPMLNSLSSDETQQWARWLRCTLCLKV